MESAHVVEQLVDSVPVAQEHYEGPFDSGGIQATADAHDEVQERARVNLTVMWSYGLDAG